MSMTMKNNQYFDIGSDSSDNNHIFYYIGDAVNDECSIAVWFLDLQVLATFLLHIVFSFLKTES